MVLKSLIFIGEVWRYKVTTPETFRKCFWGDAQKWIHGRILHRLSWSSAVCTRFAFTLPEEQRGCQYWFRQPCSSTGPPADAALELLVGHTHSHPHELWIKSSTSAKSCQISEHHVHVTATGYSFRSYGHKVALSLMCSESAAFEQQGYNELLVSRGNWAFFKCRIRSLTLYACIYDYKYHIPPLFRLWWES